MPTIGFPGSSSRTTQCACCARQQLIELDLIAYRSPLYQVLALPGAVAAPRPAPRAPAITSATTATTGANTGGPVSLATLLQLAQQRRG